jgi:hypothetical protein
MDAILLWKQNVDKEFEGIEPCPICFSILHVSNRKLPQLSCNICNNKFHNLCSKCGIYTSIYVTYTVVIIVQCTSGSTLVIIALVPCVRYRIRI